MAASVRHRWDVTPKEAVHIQRRVASAVCLKDDFKEVRTIAGADLAFDKRSQRGFAAVVLFSFPDLLELEFATLADAVHMPYVPGLLSFREAPLLIRALEKLRRKPDMLIYDGQGYAHPRRLGIASHLGVYLDLPTIGCAKSRLIGAHEEPGPKRGDTAPLTDRGEVIGMVVRTRDGVKPLYVSTGHRVALPTAVDIVLQCATRFRLPEPTRRADYLAGACKRETLAAKRPGQAGA